MQPGAGNGGSVPSSIDRARRTRARDVMLSQRARGARGEWLRSRGGSPSDKKNLCACVCVYLCPLHRQSC